MAKRTILITNDDGYQAPGLITLVDIMRPFGNLLVVAPEESHSGMSHAITIEMPVRLKKIESAEHFSFYCCSGTPVDCVKIAMDKILNKKPDLIVSGINHGSNAAISSIYSGTIAVAIEGCINSIDAIGFSVQSHSPEADLSAARIYVKEIIELYLKNGLPHGACLNVNIPSVDPAAIKGIKVCRQARGVWIEEFDKRIDPSNREYFWLTGSFKNFEEAAADTDEWALKNNYVSIVPLHFDLTHYEAIKQMNKWSLNGNQLRL